MSIKEMQRLNLITDQQIKALLGRGWGTDTGDYDLPQKGQLPKGAESFDYQGVVILGAVGLTSNILAFQVPLGYDGLIEKISHNFTAGGFVNGSGDIAWRILVGGVAAKNYNNMLSEMGSQQIPREIAGIRVYSGQQIIYQVQHIANAALNAGNTVCSLGGYFYPRRGQ